MEKKRSAGIVVILLLAFPFICFGQDVVTEVTSKYGKEIDSDIVDKCKEEAKVMCDKMCVDGFGEDCYFDSTEYNKADLKSGFTLPEETKDACFAIRSYSACGNCYKKFDLRKNDEFKEVSCDEFYQTIKDKNKICNDCVDIIYAGCC